MVVEGADGGVGAFKTDAFALACRLPHQPSPSAILTTPELPWTCRRGSAATMTVVGLGCCRRVWADASFSVLFLFFFPFRFFFPMFCSFCWCWEPISSSLYVSFPTHTPSPVFLLGQVETTRRHLNHGRCRNPLSRQPSCRVGGSECCVGFLSILISGLLCFLMPRLDDLLVSVMTERLWADFGGRLLGLGKRRRERTDRLGRVRCWKQDVSLGSSPAGWDRVGCSPSRVQRHHARTCISYPFRRFHRAI